MTVISDTRHYTGTSVERGTFSPPAFDGFSIFVETDTGASYRWNSVAAGWELMAGPTVLAATGNVAINAPTGNVVITSGGGSGTSVSLNAIHFVGSFSVATLPLPVEARFAYALDVRNLDSTIAYPGLEGPGAGTGGLVQSNRSSTQWVLPGTNITAVA